MYIGIIMCSMLVAADADLPNFYLAAKAIKTEA